MLQCIHIVRTGCESGLDPDWSVDWPYTPPSTSVTGQPCPVGSIGILYFAAINNDWLS